MKKINSLYLKIIEKMSDDSILEDLERYRRNNFELAVALNELKSELNIVQLQLLDKNRELQKVYGENAALRQSVSQKDTQIGTWRSLIIDLVTTNTKKYTEIMQSIGLVPSASGTTKSNGINPPVQVEKELSTTPKVVKNSDLAAKVQRRQKQNDYDEEAARLANLTEESISADSINLAKTPEQNISHVTARRRTSAALAPVTTSTSPLREKNNERMVTSGESRRKKRTSPKLQNIDDENSHNNATSGRPSRKTAPKNLSEPKLGTKLRRN